MIDLPSNNVHSVRKDDFELDRNINQIRFTFQTFNAFYKIMDLSERG
jgi:hypothetical protein